VSKTDDFDANAPVIAVDGPGGSGKGTIATRLADYLGWHLLDSGALYRLTALAVRNILCFASGKITVPISRPSATSPGSCRKRL
jgi:cytidylate kinase